MKKLFLFVPALVLLAAGCNSQPLQQTSNNTAQQADQSLACAQLAPTISANAISSDGTAHLAGITVSDSNYKNYYNATLGKCFVLVSYTENTPNFMSYYTEQKMLYDAIENTKIAYRTDKINRSDFSSSILYCTIAPNDGQAINTNCTSDQFDNFVISKMGSSVNLSQ